MGKSTAEILSDLIAARDNLLDALVGNEGVQELEIRGRRVKRNDLQKEIMGIEQMITYYENQSSNKPIGPVRTKAKIGY